MAESPEFTGRVIAALARRPDRMRWTGQVVVGPSWARRSAWSTSTVRRRRRTGRDCATRSRTTARSSTEFGQGGAMDVQDLVECRAIEELKYRYMRAVDTKDWELLASTLEPDVTAEYGDRLSFAGAAELVGTLSRIMTDDTITVHRLHQPEIQLDGDTATGIWALTDRVIRKKDRVMIEGASIYRDGYRRGAGGAWRIARTAYERLYESEVSLDDVPTFTLTADRFADA
jgi:ketosteroid isomerase-like protein